VKRRSADEITSGESASPTPVDPAERVGTTEDALAEAAALRDFWGLGPRVPLEGVADLREGTAVLRSKVKADRLDAVVRRPASLLGGRTLIEIAQAGEFGLLRESVASMLSLDY
jgi:hypothetical protein